MQKCLATYIFFLLIVSFSFNGHAAHATSFNKSGFSKAVAFLKTDKIDANKSNENSQDVFCRPQQSGCAVSIPGFFDLNGCHFSAKGLEPVMKMSVAKIEMQRNGYLLHLFPSHFFW